MQIFNIVGTDTEIGKTYATCAIINWLANFNYQISAIKPIASGLCHTDFGLMNEDVYQLQNASTFKLPWTIANPFSFSEAIAPHIAARNQNRELHAQEVYKSIKKEIDHYKNLDYLFIEGAGGVMLPLNETETYLDILGQLQLPIILVVGIKLGCLNHSLLSETVLNLHELPLIGWIANQIDPDMPYFEENLDYLIKRISVPLLATICYASALEPTTHFKEIFKCH